MTRRLIQPEPVEHHVTLHTSALGELIATEVGIYAPSEGDMLVDGCVCYTDGAVLWSGESPSDTPQEST